MRKQLLNVCLTALVCLMSTTAWAIEELDDVYQIGSAEDLRAFAELVNDGETLANAVLTANIACAPDQPMIGTEANQFNGVFDGQGFTVTLDAYPTENYSGVFAFIGWKGVVKNLIVDGQITTANSYAGGVAGANRGIVTCCVSKVTINSAKAGDATDGGVVGIQYFGAVTSNCLSAAKIIGESTTNCGGIVGWLSGRSIMENNLSIAELDLAENPENTCSVARNSGNMRVGMNLYLNREVATTDAEGIQVTWDDLKSGAACFALNSDQSKIVWTQNLGEDDYPVPFKTRKQVFASQAGDCMGQVPEGTTFNNTSGAECQKHNLVAGKCQDCYYWDPFFVERDAEGFRVLRTAEDLDWFAQFFDYGGEYASGRLLSDIDYKDRDGFLNTSNWFYGEFDGMGHTIEVAIPDREVENNAPFPWISGAKISNLAIKGTIETSKKFASGLVGKTVSGVSYLKNILVDVTITSTIEGDGTHGFLVGVTNGEAYVTNCLAAGEMNSPELVTDMCGGLIGYAGNATHLRNCAFLGALNIGPNFTYDSDYISRNSGNCDLNNVYYLPEIQGGFTVPSGAKKVSEEVVKNGVLAYQLNGNQEEIGFWQTIGTDPYPSPVQGNSKQVYASPTDGYRCDGKPMGTVTYSNDPSERDVPPHQYNGAFCDVCGFFNSDFKQPNVDGYYELENAKDLVWFAYKVDDENLPNLKAKLTDDIYMEEDDNAKFKPIGNSSVKYTGTFDGQFHRIHGLYIDRPTEPYTGLIGMVTGGVVVKNLILADDCFIRGEGFTGLIGGSNGSGTVTMECLGNEGEVISTAQNAGAIYGCNMGAAATPIFRNCYSTGPIKGQRESGQITGYAGNGQAYNCWSISPVEGVYYEDGRDAMLRGNPKSENCYSTEPDQNAKVVVTLDDAESGVLAWLLNEGKFVDVMWHQTLGEDKYPVFDQDHGVVYKFGEEIGCIMGDDIDALRDAIKDAELEYIQDEYLIAQLTLKEAYEVQVNDLDNVTSLEELVEAYDALMAQKEVVNACAAAYQAYIKKVTDTAEYLETHTDFECAERDFLENYLQSNSGPTEANPNGGAGYIIDEQLLSKEEIEAETQRVDELLTTAIQMGYKPGTEVTQFLKNADFHDGFNDWDGQGTGVTGYELSDGKTYYGAEHIASSAFEMTQTIKLPKKGFYMFAMNSVYRPANSFYSYSHGAYISANGNNVFIQTDREGMMPIDEAVDQVNCNLTGGTNDYPLYEIPEDPVEDEIFGYGIQGRLGMAIAISAGRIQNYIVGEVAEDSVLTVGIANPHGYSSSTEWVGFGNARLVYLGETLDNDAASEWLTTTLNGDLARANAILELYEPSNGTDYAQYPNYSTALKEELQALVNAAGGASTAADKYEYVKKFSDIFFRIYDCRMAYSDMMAKAEATANVAEDLRPIIGDEKADEISTAAAETMVAYDKGDYTAEQARAALSDIDLIPEKVNGVYQISSLAHMFVFAATVNSGETAASAVLTDDIDMGGIVVDGEPDPEGVFFTPIGTINNKPFKGTFDGQGHTLKNLVIDQNGDYIGLFGGVTGGAVIKNFIVDKNSYIGGGAFTAVVGGNNTSGQIYVEQVGMEGRVVSNAQNAAGIYGCNNGNAGTPHLLNCYVTGHVTGARESAQVCGWMGANGSEIIGCWAIGEIDGVYNTASAAGDAFYRGTAGTASNNFSNAAARNSTVSEYSASDAKSGKMTYQLNGGETDNPAWFQKLGDGGDECPKLFGTDIVYLANGKYTNEKPVIELNSYAYGISSEPTADDVTVNYALNAAARSAKINFKKGDETVYTQQLAGDELTKGKHSVTIENSNLPEAGTELTFEIEVESYGVSEGMRIKAPVAAGQYSFWRPYSIAANTNPYSINFGDLYVTESGYDHGTASGYISDQRNNGLFAFDAEFNSINAADGLPGFTGGLEMETEGIRVYDSNEAFEPKSVTFSQDGRLFIGLMGGKTNSPIYEANPDDLNEPWTPVFTGGELDPETGITWIGEDIQSGMMADITTSGKGEDLKLWTLACGRSNGQPNVTDYFAYTYDLGTKKQWDTAPSGQIDVMMNQWTIAPGGVQIAADNNGGLWYVQYRDNPTEEIPALKHINAEGKVDFSSPFEVLPRAGIAVSADGSYVAIAAGSGKVKVYNVSYVPNPNGMIMPQEKYIVSTTDSKITALAFDYAGNMYACSPSSETLNRYVLPSFTNNITITPAPAPFKVATGIQNVEVKGGENEIYTISGVRVQKAQKGVNIVNGRKVLVK